MFRCMVSDRFILSGTPFVPPDGLPSSVAVRGEPPAAVA